ncbi:hypothetical protein GCM10017764_27730 [Sphingobacterium griseoflavum]|uniref:histidine kinase n=2 Tax=Sphingobacterium griseoflavum TaxID=1474952 RepID=A0ABQ3I012_9SPHI|nr:hypothetical protein GCM10017764_27730 [Sphingobacterium griseoflavum]
MLAQTKLGLSFGKLQKEHQLLQQKQVFNLAVLSLMAHDLRAPFQNLKMLLAAEKASWITKEDNTYLSTLLHDQIQTSEKLLENLLSWSAQRLQTDEIKQDFFSVIQETEHVVSLFSLQLKQKNIILKNILPDAVVAIGETEMFQFTLRNLLSNAIKYSDENSVIEIGASMDLDTSASFVYIRDSGCGMDTVTLQEIKEKKQIPSLPGTNNEKGSGLGLALCQNLIERVGWRLMVYSRLGHGTTFQLYMPLTTQENHSMVQGEAIDVSRPERSELV